MPTQSSLPIRDGGFGLNSSSSLQRNSQLGEVYYSNEDIVLLNDIVTLGESIYPTLPERDRLPTNALFQASEQVLPAYGYVADDAPPHISRLIFKIGGHRAGTTLSEKFRSVLEGMGIELEFVPSSPASQPPRSRSLSLGSADGSDDGAAVGHVFLNRFPERRHSSGSENSDRMHIPGEGDFPPPRNRTRSVSFRDFQPETDESAGPSFRDVAEDGLTEGLDESPSTVAETNAAHYSLGSRDGSGAIRVTSDTTVQTYDDQSFAPYPEEARDSSNKGSTLQSRLELFRQQDGVDLLEDSLSKWRASTREAKYRDEISIDEDNGWAMRGAVKIWKRASREYEWKERKSSGAYRFYTMSLTLDAWRSEAKEEAQRTAVARRHLVRKRTFDGWCAQHAEDELRVNSFAFTSILQPWSRFALYSRVRGQVAVHKDEEQLLQDSVQTWHDEYRADLADDLYSCRLGDQCIETWSVAAQAAVDDHDNAIVYDQTAALCVAVGAWFDETADLTSMVYACAEEKNMRDCQHVVEQWHTQAKLSRLLKQFSTADKEQVVRNLLGIWQLATQETACEDEAADSIFLNAPLRRWNLETKVQLFRQYDEEETLSGHFHYWVLEERLSIFKRYAEEKNVTGSMDTWCTAVREAQATRLQEEALASKVDRFRTKESVLDEWLDTLEARRVVSFQHEYNSDVVLLVRKTKPCFDKWQHLAYRTIQRTVEAHRLADQADYDWTVNHVMHRWPEAARASWEERITKIYHNYRRRYKTQTAADCLQQWSEAAVDCKAGKNEADGFYVGCEQEDLLESISYWNTTSQTADYLSQVATAAELEYHAASWVDRAGDAQENEMDAIDYDVERTAAACLEDWEFAALELESRKPAIKALQEKNDRRLCRQLLDEWHQQAMPEIPLLDARFSIISRRSTRQQRRFATPLHEALSRPTSSHGSHATFQPVSSFNPAASSTEPQQLGPMAEFDDDSFAPPADDNLLGFMSTPSRRPRPVEVESSARRPSTTPSAILPSPYERELRRGYASRQGQVKFASIWEDSAED